MVSRSIRFISRVVKLFRRLKYTYHKKYLRLKDIKIENGQIWCVFIDHTYHYKITVQEILHNSNLLKQIKPENLLYIKELYDQYCNRTNAMQIVQIDRLNKYKIKGYSGKIVTFDGEVLCDNLELLKYLCFEDAYKVIYNTAYYKAIRDYKANCRFYKTNNKDPKIYLLK